MAGSVNRAIIVGNLGKDPDVRRTNDGRPVVSFNVATSESWRDKNSGERKERTEWHRVVIFSEGLCKIAEQYLKKGSKVYVSGPLQTRKWEKDGVERYSTEIVLQGFGAELQFLDGKNSVTGRDDSEFGSRAPAKAGAGADMDDEIPFAAEFR